MSDTDRANPENLPPAFADVVILDFEASTLPGDLSYPVELGLAWVSTGATLSIPIRPTDKWLATWIWDPAAAAIHGWSKDELLRVGEPVEAVVEKFERLTKGYALYSDNPRAETAWLDNLYAACPSNWWALANRRHRIYDIENLTSAALRHRNPENYHEAYLAAEKAAAEAFPRYHRADQDAGRWAYHIRHLLAAIQ